MKPNWKLGGKVVGADMLDVVGAPVQRADDTVCVRCKDMVEAGSVLEGVCFTCRYAEHLTKRVWLRIKPSLNAEGDVRFEDGVIREAYNGEGIRVKTVKRLQEGV